MNEPPVRNEVMAMFLAGHETTSNTRAWTWLLLSRHPSIERAMFHEVQNV
ncbi:MAG: cytochrome P450 [Myxococcota bacterium]|nr:cytochrome P450 [Myxococcota bacterium]